MKKRVAVNSSKQKLELAFRELRVSTSGELGVSFFKSSQYHHQGRRRRVDVNR